MYMKYLKSRDAVNEFFNPVLNGDYIQAPGIISNGSSIVPPSQTIQSTCSNDMIEKPFWLENDDDTIVMNGDIESIGTYFINGVPLTSWSAQRGGTFTHQYKKQMMQNYYYISALKNHLFPNGIGNNTRMNNIEDFIIKDLKILKMVPCHSGIGFNLYLTFKINDMEEDIWAKLENINVDHKPKFICDQINSFKQDQKIKVVGYIWSSLLSWFKPEPGVYKTLVKELMVFSELGQLKHLESGNIIEVIFSNEDYIKIKYDDKIYFIKKPSYYWFNWYFEKK